MVICYNLILYGTAYWGVKHFIGKGELYSEYGEITALYNRHCIPKVSFSLEPSLKLQLMCFPVRIGSKKNWTKILILQPSNYFSFISFRCTDQIIFLLAIYLSSPRSTVLKTIFTALCELARPLWLPLNLCSLL